MEIQEALEDIEIAFRQLEFAIKLLSFCEFGNINPADFDTDHVVLLEGGNLHFPTGQFSDQDSLTRAASISVLLAFSASVLVLPRVLRLSASCAIPKPMTASASSVH